jgi:hypothetical protein
MATRKPLVLGDDGLIQQLQAGDDIGVVVPDDLSVRTQINGESSASLVICTPVYNNAAGSVKKAKADAKATAAVVGLVYATSIAAAASGHIITSGVLGATTAQWDAVTGGSGGLVFNTLYFLDATTAGMLTSTVPASGCNVLVGRALSATELELNIQQPVLL